MCAFYCCCVHFTASIFFFFCYRSTSALQFSLYWLFHHIIYTHNCSLIFSDFIFSDFILLFIIYLFFIYLFLFFNFLQAIRYQEILFLGKKNKNNANIHPTYPEIVSEIKEKFDKLQLSSSLYYKISLFLLNKSYLSFYISTILLFYCLTIFLLYLRLAKLFLIHTEYLIFYFLFFI